MEMIEQLQDESFLLFGEMSKIQVKSFGIHDVASFSICRETSPNIIKWEEIEEIINKAKP